MNRETIEKAAKDYVMPNERIRPLMEAIFAKEGFINGAHWRINSVWHDMSEKPNGMFVILVDFGDDIGQEEYSLEMNLDGIESAKRWAYLDDLLPDGKEDGR